MEEVRSVWQNSWKEFQYKQELAAGVALIGVALLILSLPSWSHYAHQTGEANNNYTQFIIAHDNYYDTLYRSMDPQFLAGWTGPDLYLAVKNECWEHHLTALSLAESAHASAVALTITGMVITLFGLVGYAAWKKRSQEPGEEESTLSQLIERVTPSEENRKKALTALIILGTILITLSIITWMKFAENLSSETEILQDPDMIELYNQLKPLIHIRDQEAFNTYLDILHDRAELAKAFGQKSVVLHDGLFNDGVLGGVTSLAGLGFLTFGIYRLFPSKEEE